MERHEVGITETRLVRCHVKEQAHATGNASDLYSSGTRLECPAGFKLHLMIFFVAFRRLSGKQRVKCLQFKLHLFQFRIHFIKSEDMSLTLFPVAQQPNSVLGRLFLHVSTSNTIKHAHSVGFP